MKPQVLRRIVPERLRKLTTQALAPAKCSQRGLFRASGCIVCPADWSLDGCEERLIVWRRRWRWCWTYWTWVWTCCYPYMSQISKTIKHTGAHTAPYAECGFLALQFCVALPAIIVWERSPCVSEISLAAVDWGALDWTAVGGERGGVVQYMPHVAI